MTKFMITFGVGHRSNSGENLQHTYVVIDAKDDDHARTQAFALRGDRWSNIYPIHSLQFLGKRWNLNQLHRDHVQLSDKELGR